ncbi:WD40 repeat domain-containing protein, partial [Leptothoe kymatousa]|uniref:WD40 repeat domain-containing protein n=1 Tax=Leptothoe kymatousa TaxID=2651727 RepID=UPI001FEB0B5D
SDTVNAVAFSPEGDRIVSGSDDNTLRLWDREGNPIGEPLQGHSGWVYAVAFSPEGDRIVSGSFDQTLRLWDRMRWQNWLQDACMRLLGHSDLRQQNNETVQRACELCRQRAWSRRQRAEFLVAQGRDLAYEEKIDEAVAKFEEALNLDEQVLTVEPQTYAQQLAAQTAMVKGQQLAKSDQPDEAIEQFERALKLDSSRDFSPQRLTQQLQALGLITRGRSSLTNYHGQNFAQRVQGQIPHFERALSLDAALGFEPVAEVYRLATPGLEHHAQQAAEQGDIQQAMDLLEDLQTHRPDYVPDLTPLAKATEKHCKKLARQGDIDQAFDCLDAIGQQLPNHDVSMDMLMGVAGHACLYEKPDHPGVLPTLQRISAWLTTFEPENGKHWALWGLYRALTGDLASSAEDWQSWVDWVETDDGQQEDENSEYLEQAKGWIECLKAGKNPFTAEVLAELRED